MMGHSPSYSPPPGPPPSFTGSASTTATGDHRPEGTVVQQDAHALTGTGSSSHEAFAHISPYQYAFHGPTPPPGPIQDARYPHWGSNNPTSGPVLVGQIYTTDAAMVNTPYGFPTQEGSEGFEWQSSWTTQPPSTAQHPTMYNFSPVPQGDIAMYPPVTPQYTQWPPLGQSSGPTSAIVPRPSSTHSSHSSTYDQSPYIGVPPVALRSELAESTSTYVRHNDAAQLRADAASAPGAAKGPAHVHRTGLRSRPNTASISPVAGSSVSTQATAPFEGDEDADADGETDIEAMSEAEVPPDTRKRKRKGVMITQRGKGGKRQSKMHTCPQCSKQFPRPSGLEIHVTSVHSGKKPYGCPVSSCQKYFAVRSNMTRHLKTHGAEGAVARKNLDWQADVSSGVMETGLTFGFQEPQTIPSPTTWSQPTNYKWVHVPESLAGRTNIGALRQRAASSSSLSGSSSTTSMTRARLSTSPSSSTDQRGSRRTRSPFDDDEALLPMPMLSSPLPLVTPSPPNAVALLAASPPELVDYIVSNGGIEERDSYARYNPYPYHPSQFQGLPGPAPAVIPL